MIGSLVDPGQGSVDSRTHVVAGLFLTDPADTLKMLRETLARAQDAIVYTASEGGWVKEDQPDIDRLERIIQEIDRQRPLGADGKHGDLHTATCGCV